MIEAIARAAAEWWGDRLLNRVDAWQQFRDAGYFSQDAESFRAGLFGGGLVDMILEKSPPPTEEKVALFVERLAMQVLEHIERSRDTMRKDFWVTLSTDYHPCGIIMRAAEGLEIKNIDLRLPWKTCMWIEPDQIRVRDLVLWQTKRRALATAAENRVREWLDSDARKAGPRWKVFGYSAPGSYRRDGGEAPRDEAAEQLWWSDDAVARRRLVAAIKELPDHPNGDFDALAKALADGAVARVPSVLGIVPGARWKDSRGAWVIEAVGNVPDKHRDRCPFYGETVTCVPEDGASDAFFAKVETFSEWWLDRAGSFF